jgi:hypothetical protein
MPSSRPDFPKFLEWLNVADTGVSPLVILARSGGRRETDTLEVFPCPERLADNTYETRFFIHGLSHTPSASAERAERLSSGEQLLLMWDFQNAHDPDALAVRTSETYPGDMHILGYCPRYLRGEILRLMSKRGNPPFMSVERVNPAPAPVQFRVLCRLRMKWEDEFEPFSDSEYEPIIGSDRKSETRHVA